MRKVSLQQQAVELIEQLSTEKLKTVLDYLSYLQDKEAWEATHELASDARDLDEFLEHYAQVWKTQVNVPQPSAHTGLDDQAPKDIEKTLQKVRAEAEEERRLDQELDAIPETVYEDVDRFLKTINGFVPLPDMMPLDNGEICLEWREGQKMFTMSFGGDGHIVFAGIFSAEHPRFHRDVPQARGILTFSMPHLIAVIGMITGLYLHYGVMKKDRKSLAAIV